MIAISVIGPEELQELTQELQAWFTFKLGQDVQLCLVDNAEALVSVEGGIASAERSTIPLSIYIVDTDREAEDPVLVSHEIPQLCGSAELHAYRDALKAQA